MAQDLTQYTKNVDAFFADLPTKEFEPALCIFCGKDQETKTLFHKNTMHIVRCGCGLVFNANQASIHALDHFYTKSRAMNDWSSFKHTDPETSRQKNKFALAVRFLLDKKVGSVLDIGCGAGLFLNLIREADEKVRLCGVDQGQTDHQANNVNFFRRNYEDFFNQFPRAMFDAITLWGVLEHVKDPLKLLRLCKNRINAGGHLIACVPNCESEVVERLMDICFTFCPQHLWYFNKTTLRRIFYQAGFLTKTNYTIESEALPLARHSLNLPPYQDMAQDTITVHNRVFGLAEWILHLEKGYKIVAIGSHSGSGNNTSP